MGHFSVPVYQDNTWENQESCVLSLRDGINSYVWVLTAARSPFPQHLLQCWFLKGETCSTRRFVYHVWRVCWRRERGGSVLMHMAYSWKSGGPGSWTGNKIGWVTLRAEGRWGLRDLWVREANSGGHLDRSRMVWFLTWLTRLMRTGDENWNSHLVSPLSLWAWSTVRGGSGLRKDLRAGWQGPGSIPSWI